MWFYEHAVDRFTMSAMLHGPGASGEARRAVRSALAGHPEASVETAALLASELVTNAVLHGDNGAMLAIELHDPSVRISVTDVSDRMELAPLVVEPSSVHGRGLSIVDQLAGAWGVQPGRSGKTVWVELDVA